MPVADDAVLLRSYALEGDAGAFAELVKRYAGLVYATARRITGSADAADDVSQDCFLRLAQKSAGINGSVPAWLHRASVNRSLEIIRAERARKQREVAAVTPRPPVATDDPAELIGRVDEALAALPDELRVVVTEHFLCARSQVELAAALEVNQSTISRRIDQGVRELRAKLNSDGWTLAPLALPLLLQQSFTATTAPATVCGALTKIGLSGVGGGSAVAVKTAAGASMILRLSIAVASCAVVVGGGLLLRSQFKTPPPQHSAAPATAPSVSKNADDDDDDNGLDDKIDSLLGKD